MKLLFKTNCRFLWHLISFLTIVFLFQLSSCKTPAIIATQTIQQADEFNNNRNYDQAIVHYRKYLELAPKLGVYRNYTMEADVYRKLAHAYSTKTKYDSSLFFLQRALRIDSTLSPGSLEVIEDYRQIGLTYGYIGDYNKSLTYLQKSLALNTGMEKSLKETKRLSIGDTYLSLAQVNYVMGDFNKALEQLEQAVSVYRNIDKEYLGLLEAWLLKGKIKTELGYPKEGLEWIQRSVKIAADNGLNTARHYQVIGSIMLAGASYEEALKARLEALKQAKESKIIPQISWMNVKVGDVYTYIGDDKKAESYYETALRYLSTSGELEVYPQASLQMRLGDVQGAWQIFLSSGSKTGAALASMRLGEMKEKELQLVQAADYFKKADSLFSLTGSKSGQAYAKLALCRVLTDENKAEDAIKLLKKIIKPSKDLEFEWQWLFEKGRIFEKQKNIDSAYQNYTRAIEMIEDIRGQLNIEEFRSAYMKDKMHVYERLIMLLIENSEGGAFKNLKQNPVTTAFYYSEKARSRSFLDMISNTKISSKKPADTTLLAKEHRLRMQIQKVSKEIQQNSFGLNDTDELEKYLEFLNKEYLKTLDMVKLSSSEYNSLLSVDPPKLAEVQKLVPDKGALLEYWVGSEKLVIWVISEKTISAKVVKTGDKEISSLVKNCRTSIQPYTSRDYEQMLADLYKLLILPVEKEISSFETLYFIPHRSLHFLPFQALVDKNGKYLVENYHVAYAPSAAVLKHCSLKTKESGKSFLGMALGDLMLESFSPLPGTKIELKQIIQLYQGAMAKYENESSETFFKKAAPAYSILHIATHGYLDNKNPMASYLLMLPDNENDGQLSVEEIFRLDLSSGLVVLSACETGLGRLSKGDELIGLSRAFIYAGTPAIVVSLWPVDDASTALLMTRLHQYYAAGYSLQDAITFAQRDLINNNFNTSVKRGTNAVVWDEALETEIRSGNKSKKRNPFFWAPFILVGFGG